MRITFGTLLSHFILFLIYSIFPTTNSVTAQDISGNPVLPNGRLGEFGHGTPVIRDANDDLVTAPSPSMATHTHTGVDIVAD